MKIDNILKQEFENDIQNVLGSERLNKLAGKTVLLLGGSGFLGSLFKLFLLNCNNNKSINPPCKVISVDNYIKGTTTVNDETEDVNLISINHDLTVPLGLKLGKEKIDYIINCSGNASPRQYEKYPIETMDISSIAVRHLLELALNHKAKILNFSSSEVLGTPPDDEIPTSEESVTRIPTGNKRAPYDFGKTFIEGMSWSFKQAYGLECKVIRPFNVIGRFHKNDFRVIPNYLNKLLNNEKIHVFKPGTQTRTFCYYTDFLVGCFLVLMESKDWLYHVGNSDNEISMIDLALKLQEIAGKKDLVSLVETPEVYKHEPKRRCPCIKKVKEELGYVPRISINEALERIYNWAKDNY